MENKRNPGHVSVTGCGLKSPLLERNVSGRNKSGDNDTGAAERALAELLEAEDGAGRT